MFALSVSAKLELRHYELHHAPLLLELVVQSRAHLHPYLEFAETATLASLEDFIRRSRQKFVSGTGCNFGIWRNNTLIGNIGFFDHNPTHRKAEIGYWISAAFVGQGIMTQVVAKMLDYGFSALGLNRIQLCCTLDNLPSQRVAQKNGFRLEGQLRKDRILHQARVSHQIWSILAREHQTIPADFAKSLGNRAELRLLEPKHASQVFAAIDSNRQHLRRFLPWVDSNSTVQHSSRFIDFCLEQFKDFDGFNAGIWQNGIFAGVIGIHYIDYTNLETTFGYWLREDFTGQGLVTKASRALLDYIFVELKLQRVGIAHALENTASKRVIERLGFKPEALLRDAEWLYNRFHDWQWYGLLREEHESSKAF